MKYICGSDCATISSFCPLFQRLYNKKLCFHTIHRIAPTKSYKTSMRFPTFPTLLRTFYTFSNYSARVSTQYRSIQPLTRGAVLKSMPTIPFLSTFFGTSSSSSSSNNMSHPVQKTDDEWRAVLNKGNIPRSFSTSTLREINMLTHPPRSIPRPPPKGNRSPLRREIRQAHARRRRLHLRRLRRTPL